MSYMSRVGGYLLGGPQRPVYVQGTGIKFEVPYRDDKLCNLDKSGQPDNLFELTFMLSDATLTAMAGMVVNDATEALAIFHKNKNKVLAAVARGLEERGLSSPGGRPRAIPVQDLSNAR